MKLSKVDKFTYLSLFGVLLIILVNIYNNAFKNGKFTCNKYILNSYLYIFLGLILITMEVLFIDSSKYDMKKMYNKIGILLLFIVSLGMLFITLWINPRYVFLKHLFWVFLLMIFGYILYPSYKISKKNNTFLSVIITLLVIMVFFSLIVYINPNLVSLSWGPMLVAILLGIIVYSLINTFIFNNTRPKWMSYVIIVLFIFFVMYDTKKIKIDAKKCRESTVDYINGSLALILDAMNLFQNLVISKM